MKYNIPNDTGAPWRWNKLIEACKLEEIVKDDPSPSIALKIWADGHKCGNEERFWLSFLYGLTYSTATTLQIFSRFPTLKYAIHNFGTLNQYWLKNKKRLYFNRDRRYVQSNNQFCNSIKSLHNWCGDYPYETIVQYMTDTRLYNEIVKGWNYFGRHAAFLFFDAYSLLLNDGKCDLAVIPDWKQASTIAKGLACATYDDDLLLRAEQNKLTKHDCFKLDGLMEKLLEDTVMDLNEVESTICAYYKLFKGTRYFGYYIDRFQDELIKCKKNGYDKGLIRELYEIRKEINPHEYLGELNDWNGIQKSRCKSWLLRGEFR